MNTTSTIGLGKTLGSIRRLSGIKQKVFAQKIGISTAYLCQVEKERRVPSLALLISFAEALNTTLEAVLIEWHKINNPEVEYSSEEWGEIKNVIGDCVNLLVAR